MSETYAGTRAAVQDAVAPRAASRQGFAAHWLSLAAAPAFAAMALLTGISDGGRPDTFCTHGPDPSPLGGMVLMYLLMSVFHAAPWLKLIAGRRPPRRRRPGRPFQAAPSVMIQKYAPLSGANFWI